MTEHLSRKDSEEIVKEQVRNALIDLQNDKSAGPYVDDAIVLLDTRWDDILLPRLKHRKPFIKIAKAFMYWSEAAQGIMGEKHVVSGATKEEDIRIRLAHFQMIE